LKKTEKIELANFKKKLRYIPCSLFKVHGNEMHSFVTQALQDSPLVAGCGTKFSLKIFEIVFFLTFNIYEESIGDGLALCVAA
jgi:hypothetical protein